MSIFEEDIQPANPEHQIDRLVDGELGESERRNLLLQFEHEPDGWRRCALAFLEAQCWKAELRQMASPAAREAATDWEALAGSPQAYSADSLAGGGANSAPRRQTWRQHLATVLSMAASFLIALMLGMGLRGNWSGNASHSPDTSVLATATHEFPLGSRDELQTSVAASVPAVPVAASASDTAASHGWEMVTLAGAKSEDGRAQTVCVPAQCRDALDQEMLEHIPDAIPPEMQQAFEQSGHRVLQQREIVPVQMKDGRRLVVPVDHVEIHYVGRPSL